MSVFDADVHKRADCSATHADCRHLLQKAALDDICEGLCVLRFNEVFQNFLEEFEPLFVAVTANKLAVSPATLLDMLKAECSCGEDEITYRFLKTYIESLDFEGTESIFCGVGNSAHQGREKNS